MPQIEKFAEKCQKWQPIQLVSALISSASKEVNFVALSWALMLLFAYRRYSGEFFLLMVIVVWCFCCHWAWLLNAWCCCCHGHGKRWSKAFMQRAQHLWLCLEHWCCCLLAEGAAVNVSGWGWLFDVVATIYAQGMRKIMPHVSIASMQRVHEFLLLSWALMLLCICKSFCTEISLFSMIAICLILLSSPSKVMIRGIHALLIVFISYCSYFSPNSDHTCDMK